MIRLYSFLFLFFTISSQVLSQTPFTCEGQLFITMRNNGTSDLVRLDIDEENDQVSFDVKGNLGELVNSAGYRLTDNFIYGFNPNNRTLYRVGSDFTAYDLQTYSSPTNLSRAPAGDVTPDGNFLVLIGARSSDRLDADLIFIDLTDPNYPIDHTVDISANGTKSFDFAIDPSSGLIYGIDAKTYQVFIIDPNDGSLVNRFSAAPFVIEAGAIFFDAFGQLWAYGATSAAGIHNTLFKIDKETGEIEIAASGPTAGGTDACSCPYTIEITKSTINDSFPSCNSFTYYLDIANQYKESIQDVDLEDHLPSGFEITNIEIPSSFTGSHNIISGVGTNTLEIEGLNIPVGRDSILITVDVGSISGWKSAQALLSNLPSVLGSTRLSDDPNTGAVRDSTAVYIIPNIDTTFTEIDLVFCEGDSVQIDANALGRPYSWSHANQDSVQFVSVSGIYTAEVKVACKVIIRQYNVTRSTVEIEDIPITAVAKGASVDLTAVITSFFGTDTSYQWESQSTLLTCPTCRTTSLRAEQNDTLTYIVTNEYGCSDTANAIIDVFVTGPFWIPNAFSPNDDGHNDIFYIYGEGYQIIYFDIYDQWGKKHYELPAGPTGFPDIGWRGETIHDLDQNPNVYIYVGRLQDAAGMFHDVSGTITVMR